MENIFRLTSQKAFYLQNNCIKIACNGITINLQSSSIRKIFEMFKQDQLYQPDSFVVFYILKEQILPQKTHDNTTWTKEIEQQDQLYQKLLPYLTKVYISLKQDELLPEQEQTSKLICLNDRSIMQIMKIAKKDQEVIDYLQLKIIIVETIIEKKQKKKTTQKVQIIIDPAYEKMLATLSIYHINLSKVALPITASSLRRISQLMGIDWYLIVEYLVIVVITMNLSDLARKKKLETLMNVKSVLMKKYSEFEEKDKIETKRERRFNRSLPVDRGQLPRLHIFNLENYIKSYENAKQASMKAVSSKATEKKQEQLVQELNDFACIVNKFSEADKINNDNSIKSLPSFDNIKQENKNENIHKKANEGEILNRLIINSTKNLNECLTNSRDIEKKQMLKNNKVIKADTPTDNTTYSDNTSENTATGIRIKSTNKEPINPVTSVTPNENNIQEKIKKNQTDIKVNYNNNGKTTEHKDKITPREIDTNSINSHPLQNKLLHKETRCSNISIEEENVKNIHRKQKVSYSNDYINNYVEVFDYKRNKHYIPETALLHLKEAHLPINSLIEMQDVLENYFTLEISDLPSTVEFNYYFFARDIKNKLVIYSINDRKLEGIQIEPYFEVVDLYGAVRYILPKDSITKSAPEKYKIKKLTSKYKLIKVNEDDLQLEITQNPNKPYAVAISGRNNITDSFDPQHSNKEEHYSFFAQNVKYLQYLHLICFLIFVIISLFLFIHFFGLIRLFGMANLYLFFGAILAPWLIVFGIKGALNIRFGRHSDVYENKTQIYILTVLTVITIICGLSKWIIGVKVFNVVHSNSNFVFVFLILLISEITALILNFKFKEFYFEYNSNKALRERLLIMEMI